ncbi:hypothetical protein BCR39DRAFT_35741 [Naematelia encephala]|uniref:Uncharacterized protein n=1 Tax=Naematelia encephala TaxID=71784 RepID=A0A1Y2BM34_9TREE|nr:hypothetical protein BCR39DRAFT_35741 [Naematelia encephala]
MILSSILINLLLLLLLIPRHLTTLATHIDRTTTLDSVSITSLPPSVPTQLPPVPDHFPSNRSRQPEITVVQVHQQVENQAPPSSFVGSIASKQVFPPPYAPLPSPSVIGPSPFLHPLAILLLILIFIGFIATFHPNTLPFNIMPSEAPRASSSSSSASKPKDPRADPRAASSSSSRPSGSSSSSGGGSTSSSSSSPKVEPPNPGPTISANAWMSFFLFCCLVLIILQGPLGLTGGTGVFPTLPGFGMAGGLPGCGGLVATTVPWCAQVAPVQAPAPAPAPIIIQAPQEPCPPAALPQMGGQGNIAGPYGGGGWSWYSNSPQPQPRYYYPRERYDYRQGYGYYAPPRQGYRAVQYQRPGLQVQVAGNPGMLCWYYPYLCNSLINFGFP